MSADARLVQIGRPQATREGEAVALPYPTGWFCLGWSEELPRGGVLARRLAGHELVLFRTQAGQAAALDAHCAHLGAHLAHGGTVEEDTIRCPFHGFCFDTGGACVKTGYGTKPPPKARMRAWPLLERHGVLLVFFDPLGRSPTWEVPDADMTGWTRLRHHDVHLNSHPQEIAENSVDLGHFRHIHGYEDVTELASLETTGPYLHARYSFRRRRRAVGSFRDISVSVEIHQHGLGYAIVEARTSIGMLGRQLVMTTPTDPGQAVLRIGNSIRRADGPRSPLLALVPTRLLAALAFAEFRRDVEQDLVIWNNKRHITPPALALGDGPVGAYRRWARQFYEEGA
jgi:phenylpropionate dioxygenase-like ring-hydroxylating dioxygenase large terminal subunit